MIKLEIFNPDGSLYWTMHFKSMRECDKWLAEEKTRRYWKQDFGTQITDMTKPIDQVEADRDQAKKDRLKALVDKHAAMRPQDLDTIVEMRQAILEIQEILGLR